MAGRPLRFLGVTLGGWISVRVVLLWPTVDTVPDLIHAIVPGVARAAGPVRAPVAVIASSRHMPHVAPSPRFARAVDAGAAQTRDPRRLAFALAGMVAYGREESIDAPGAIPPPLRPTRVAAPPKRLSASLWGIARGGSEGSLLGGQLGGSQAGMRITYGLGATQRVALAARLAGAPGGRGPGRREAALGLEWRPRGAPVRGVIEQRIALDGGRSGLAAGVIAGLDPMPLTAGFRLEAYGQAGAILRDRVEGYADGAARIARPVAASHGLALDLGIGAWGGVQPGAGRIDLGPSIGVAIPAGDHMVRVTLDWRQRIAGAARPGSGPALSIGSDF